MTDPEIILDWCKKREYENIDIVTIAAIVLRTNIAIAGHAMEKLVETGKAKWIEDEELCRGRTVIEILQEKKP